MQVTEPALGVKHEYSDQISSKNKYGEWVPAIPLPYYLAFGRVRCQCQRKFRDEEQYRGHYALDHILGL